MNMKAYLLICYPLNFRTPTNKPMLLLFHPQ